ncbi:uncharacterized protein [Musca autumnalis]|uniref:uncharacterized protein n=1 Tax=Musca autumnalis TaxID=221902 RepID=UPI003CF1BD13
MDNNTNNNKPLNKQITLTDDDSAIQNDDDNTLTGECQPKVIRTVVSGGNDIGVSDLSEIHDSLTEQSRQLLTLLDKTLNLRLSQGSSHANNIEYASSSDDEMDVTVIQTSSDGHGSSMCNPVSSDLVDPTKEYIEKDPSSAKADRLGLTRQNAVEAGGPMKTTSDSIPATARRRRTAESKRRGGYRRSLNFLRKFVGREPSSLSEREVKLIRLNLKTVQKFERTHPQIPKKSSRIEGIPLPSLGERANMEASHTPAGTHSEGVKVYAAPTESKNEDTGRTQLEKTVGRSDSNKASASKDEEPKANPRPQPSSSAKRARSTEEPHPSSKKPSRSLAGEPSTSSVHHSKSKPKENTIAGAAEKAGPSHKVPFKGSKHGGKIANSTSSRTLTPDSLRVAVIDRAAPEGQIRESRWRLFEERLRDIIFSGDGDSTNTQFGSATLYKGVKVISCENKESLNFLVSTVNGLGSLWEGCELAAVSVDEIPCGRIMSAWVPPPLVDPARILTILKKQNPNLQTDNWRLISSNPDQEGLTIRVSIDASGQGYLRQREGKLHFGSGWIRFRTAPRQ